MQDYYLNSTVFFVTVKTLSAEEGDAG